MKNYNIPTVKNMRTRGGNAAPNQFVIRQDDKVIFQSYNSTIVIVDYHKEIIAFGENFNYSRTTNKYMYQFFDDLFINIGNKDDIIECLEIGRFEDAKDRLGRVWVVERL